MVNRATFLTNTPLIHYGDGVILKQRIGPTFLQGWKSRKSAFAFNLIFIFFIPLYLFPFSCVNTISNLQLLLSYFLYYIYTMIHQSPSFMLNTLKLCQYLIIATKFSSTDCNPNLFVFYFWI
jgi:hypothetical protein